MQFFDTTSAVLPAALFPIFGFLCIPSKAYLMICFKIVILQHKAFQILFDGGHDDQGSAITAMRGIA